jgi:hypothetical protein
MLELAEVLSPDQELPSIKPNSSIIITYHDYRENMGT